ncbi:hypothetical protein DDB_G0268236 [Dictyostelium discoideum AX4]|uniref:Uncharacterized protein n=1 Tax=Dictyostelium discoideum TaxID=44689 RepID=Q55F70_DICDI|nr:hypothetical protein DDB_G0268236 [Dictyostelium discoideum AX4]EAL73571.1 hypothetical protein DDB_G0268236 [Dictyostelium discoideum AX4]|eukprot:XP_647663.1 hypothetical protein DDB_G0268236 [Dictyostelium discoideum AX4]
MSDKSVKKTTTTTTTNNKNNNTKGGEKKQNNNNNNNNNNNKINNRDGNNNNTNSDNKDNKYPPDPVYDAHQKRINELRNKIVEINNNLENLKKDMVELKKKHTGYKESIEKIYEGNKSRTSDPMKAQTIEARNTLKALMATQEEKKKILISLEDQLPIKISKNAEEVDTMCSIEERIRELEEQVENETNPNQQRALLKKLSQVNSSKKYVTEYYGVKNEFEKIKKQVTEQKAQVNELSAQIKPEEPREKQEAVLKELKQQRKDVETEIKENNDKFVASRGFIEEIKKDIEEEKALLEAHVVKRKEQRKLEQEQRKLEQEQRRQELLEKKKAEEEKRIQEDLLKVPYEKEMNNCDSLISYLKAITPKETTNEQSALDRNIAEIEEGFVLVKKEKVSKNRENPKKKALQQQQPKAQPDTIRHPLEIFSDFEKLSMAPPPKYSDIPEYIDQIKSKKDHYSKLSATQMEERLAKAKADKEAAATAATTTTAEKEKSADEKVTTTTEEPTPVAPIDDNATSNSTENKNVEVEAQ